MIYVQISENISAPEEVSVLERAANQTLQQTSASEADLCIVLTDDEQLRQLNSQFLGVDAPTDVLSFPDGEVDPDTGLPYLGDVLICVPRAQAQATAGGHPLTSELQLLVVHGVLHLLGHDHAEPDEKARMWQIQAEILTQIGCSITSPDS
jgi:probable rRNA maturation factor